MLHKAEGRVGELAMAAARLAREVADSSGRVVAVGGSVGPTGDLFAPLGPITEAEAVEVFVEQIEAMKAGGIDIVWIETMSAPEEMRAAALAAIRCGMPYTVTGSFDTAGRTMMGLTPEGMAEFVKTLPEPPLAFGANCGVGASDLLASVGAMTAADPAAVVIAKGNCGIPEFRGEKIHYSGTPEVMSNYACMAVDSGVRIIGGCCGTAPEHLKAIRHAVDTHLKGARPTHAEIVAGVGPFVNAVPGGEASEASRDRSRRRRS
jgi:5-methyltetrahydrofolate--homocysteine methyltransferase